MGRRRVAVLLLLFLLHVVQFAHSELETIDTSTFAAAADDDATATATATANAQPSASGSGGGDPDARVQPKVESTSQDESKGTATNESTTTNGTDATTDASTAAAVAGAPVASDNTTTKCNPLYGVVVDATEATARCQCKTGFSGFGCGMCANDKVCNGVTTGSTCHVGLEYPRGLDANTYDCVLDGAIAALFPDSGIAMQCNTTTTASNCHIAVFKLQDSLAGEHFLDCTTHNCKFDKTGTIECETFRCQCGKSCSSMVKELVESTMSGQPITMKVSDKQKVSLDIKGSPVPLTGTCKASHCFIANGAGAKEPANSGGTSLSTSATISLVVLGLALLALIVTIVVCRFYMAHHLQQDHVDIDQILAASSAMPGKMLQFRHLCCQSPPRTNLLGHPRGMPRQILHDLSGSVRRGQVMGLLGPSGSGKTSLLNALAGVENGRAVYSGELLIDGCGVNIDYRRLAAYVHQDDALYATLTVRECIQYSAQLRLPCNIAVDFKEAMVDRVIDELNLRHVADARVGSSGAKTRGISGGERRRVSIGMELVTSPQILFLDEPTSGLDSNSANSVVLLLKKLAKNGRIVILSVHQPSEKAFMSLDLIMLIAKGQQLYFGSPKHVTRQFEQYGLVCPKNDNVADFILDVASDPENLQLMRERSGGSVGDLETALPIKRSSITVMDSPMVYHKHSIPILTTPSLYQRPASNSQDLGMPVPASPTYASSSVTTTPNRSILIELSVLFRRTAINLVRNKSLVALHLALSVALGLGGGIIFNHVSSDLAGFQNRSGAFMFVLTFFAFSSLSSMTLFLDERTIFKREAGAMYYSPWSYFMAKTTLDTLSLRVVPVLLFASLFYWLMRLDARLDHFVWFVVTLVLFNMAAGSISVFVSIVSKEVAIANLVATVVFLFMLLFGGFLLNAQSMNAATKLCKFLSIYSYAFEILMTTELKGLVLTFNAPGYPTLPVYGDVFLQTMGMRWENRAMDLVCLLGIFMVLQVVSFVCLKRQVPSQSDFLLANRQSELVKGRGGYRARSLPQFAADPGY